MDGEIQIAAQFLREPFPTVQDTITNALLIERVEERAKEIGLAVFALGQWVNRRGLGAFGLFSRDTLQLRYERHVSRLSTSHIIDFVALSTPSAFWSAVGRVPKSSFFFSNCAMTRSTISGNVVFGRKLVRSSSLSRQGTRRGMSSKPGS